MIVVAVIDAVERQLPSLTRFPVLWLLLGQLDLVELLPVAAQVVVKQEVIAGYFVLVVVGLFAELFAGRVVATFLVLEAC